MDTDNVLSIVIKFYSLYQDGSYGIPTHVLPLIRSYGPLPGSIGDNTFSGQFDNITTTVTHTGRVHLVNIL